MTEDPLVLAIGSNPRNLELLGRYLNEAGCRALKASHLEEVDAVLDNGTKVDLAIVDVTEYGTTIWDRCRRLHESGVPHLILSASSTEALRRRGMSSGAGAVLEKPVAIRRLMGLVWDLLGTGPGS